MKNIFILLLINFNPLYAHQPFEILINEWQSHFVNLRDASISHAFYGVLVFLLIVLIKHFLKNQKKIISYYFMVLNQAYPK